MYLNAYQRYVEELIGEYESLLLSQLLNAVNFKFGIELPSIEDYARQMCYYGDFKIGDSAEIVINKYNHEKKLVYGKILRKMIRR